MFNIIIKDKNEISQWNVPYLSWSFTEELNNDKNASFSWSYEHLLRRAISSATTPINIIYGSFRWVEIWRDSTLLYKGYLRMPSFSRDENSKGEYSQGSKGIFSLLDRRLTNDVLVRPEQTFFGSEDLSDIAWNLINYTQNRTYGDLGITRGLNPITRDAQRTYYYNKIGSSIDSLSNKNIQDGFDYEIDVHKNFNVYYPYKGTGNGVVFEDGINILTINNLERPSIDELVNEAVCKSDNSFGEGSLIASSSGSIENKIAYGLLEEMTSDTATQLSTVQEKADGLITRKENPFVSVEISVDGYKDSKWDITNTGDVVILKIPSQDINGTFRIYARSLNHENIETYKLSEDVNIWGS